MRFSRPSTGTILGAIALFIALGGTAAAATGSLVNIADPTNAAHIAHVNASGQLQISGSTSVTNTVNTELAAPSTYVHSTTLDLTGSSGCVEIATPPSGKAMIVRDVKIDVYSDPSPGSAQHVNIYDGTKCSLAALVADVNPATVGETTLPFDPGLGVPANSGLSTFVGGSVEAEIYTEGYSVAPSQVVATGITATGKVGQHQQ
jgi:hypothetical protein